MTDDDLELQDAAADLRAQGLSWDQIAHELAIPIGAAQRAAASAQQRAAELAARNQHTLF